MKPSKMLEQELDKFRDAMLQKFIDRHEKAIRRWGSSVVDADFRWNKLSLEQIEEHLKEEIDEWIEDDGENRLIEDVDIANMVFLDWAVRRFLSFLKEKGQAELDSVPWTHGGRGPDEGHIEYS